MKNFLPISILALTTACQPTVDRLVDKADRLPDVDVERRIHTPYVDFNERTDRWFNHNEGTEILAILDSVQAETARSLQSFKKETEVENPGCRVRIEVNGTCFWEESISIEPSFTILCWEEPNRHPSWVWEGITACESNHQ